jgi:hypothetical protein
MSEGNGTSDYVFGTANGIFAVDNPNGTILGLKKAATKDFDPTFAGTYKAIYYQKTGMQTGQGNVRTGTAGLGNTTMVISADAQITGTDTNGAMLVRASLPLRLERTSGPLLRPFYFPCDHGDVTAGCVRKFHGSRDLILFLQGKLAVGCGQHVGLSVRGRA